MEFRSTVSREVDMSLDCWCCLGVKKYVLCLTRGRNHLSKSPLVERWRGNCSSPEKDHGGTPRRPHHYPQSPNRVLLQCPHDQRPDRHPPGNRELRLWYPSLLYLSLIHISEPTRLGMISYAVFCLKK